MNYLAHAFLSFNEPAILVGNMISDFVKGKAKYSYPENIQKGINLHRAIDSFTDSHIATQQAKIYFKPVVGLYAGAFVDVVYDHFLATDKNQFANNIALEKFAENVYQTLQANISFLPEKFKNMLPYMQQQNWLYNYQYNWGIDKSFQGLVHRAKYLESSQKAFEVFEKNYAALSTCYQLFFQDVKSFSEKEIHPI